MRRLWNAAKHLLAKSLTPEQFVSVRRAALNALSHIGITNSQYRMDKRLALLFGNKRGGVFIEAGAADGLDQSNTLYLERMLGWRGLLVEPSAEQAKVCRRVRARSKVEHAVLCPAADHGKTCTLFESGLMSIVRESKSDSLTRFDGHVSELRGKGSGKAQKVRAASLGKLLAKHGLKEVDIFSLDVEGAELYVLKGVDFKKHLIRYLLVESNDFKRLGAFLKPHYTFVEKWSGSDYLFKSKRA